MNHLCVHMTALLCVWFTKKNKLLVYLTSLVLLSVLDLLKNMFIELFVYEFDYAAFLDIISWYKPFISSTFIRRAKIGQMWLCVLEKEILA